MKIITAAAAVLIAAAAAVSLLFLFMNREKLFLPNGIVWHERSFAIDSSGSTLKILLRNKRIEAALSGRNVFSTDKQWKVQDALICDIDGDGADELLMLVWKRGSYGEHRPIWVEKDETAYSQHLFIYDLFRNGGGEPVMPLWMSSDIGTKMDDWYFDPEKRCLYLTDAEGRETAWIWQFFGLKLAAAPETDITTDAGPGHDTESTETDTAVEMDESEDTKILHLLAFGDVIAHSPVLNAANYDTMFKPLESLLSMADIAAVNQETPLVLNGEYSDYPFFASPPDIAYAMADAGFNVATCATNHMADMGLQGIRETREVFDDLSDRITCLGINSDEAAPSSGNAVFSLGSGDVKPLTIITVNGIRAALLNYTYALNKPISSTSAMHYVETLEDEDRVHTQLKTARKAADLVILFVHWGTEYSHEPDEFQTYWTGVFLEEGADLVIGTHPHTVQPVEKLERSDGHSMLVYYSLGNLLSAQVGIDRILGAMADVTIEIDKAGNCSITNYDILPVVTHQEKENYSAWLLSDYTESMAARHRQEISIRELTELWDSFNLIR